MKLDLHVHSARSEDGILTTQEIIDTLRKKGFDGAAIADHQTSPLFECAPEDFLLIPAIEYSTQKGHLLGLFLQKPVGKTEEKRTDFFEAVQEIHAAGGLAVLAHPFEQAADFSGRERELEELLPQLDGIEIGNGRADYKYAGANEAAARFSAAHNLPVTGGSDAHRKAELGAFWFETTAEKSIEAAREAILARNGTVHGKSSPRRHIALAQLTKCRKTHSGVLYTLKSAAFLIKMLGKDVFCK